MSHEDEVRTPLNSVCMGLMLMQEEIAKSTGCNSVDKLKLIERVKDDEDHPVYDLLPC